MSFSSIFLEFFDKLKKIRKMSAQTKLKTPYLVKVHLNKCGLCI